MVSRMTIYCRRAEFGMLDDPSTSIGEEELVSIVCQISMEHPQVGQRFIMGWLQSLGYQVARERIRQAVCVCDSLSTALHWHGNPAYRRPYSVPGPNYLWHIGKYHNAIILMVNFFAYRWPPQAHTLETCNPGWH